MQKRLPVLMLSMLLTACASAPATTPLAVSCAPPPQIPAQIVESAIPETPLIGKLQGRFESFAKALSAFSERLRTTLSHTIEQPK